MAATLSGATFAMSNNNAGECADYTFTFKSSTGFATTDSIEIYFPNAFDPFVGMASAWFENEPNSYYLECSSTALSLVWCKVDKWKVTITGSAAVEAANNIDITLKYVANPAKGTTGQKLIVSIINTSGVYQSTLTDFAAGGVTTVDPPAKDILFNVMSSNSDLFGSNADYTFAFWLQDTTLETDENVQVKFPMQYDLYLNDGVD